MRRALATCSLGLAMLACSPAPLRARSVPDDWHQPVQVRVEPGFRAAVLPVHGTYDQWSWATWKLGVELQWMGVTPSGPLFARYLNDSAQVSREALRWEVGFPVAPSAEVQPPLELRELGPQLVAATRTRAPLEEVARQWRGFVEWIAENGYQQDGAWMMVVYRGGDGSQEIELRAPVVKVSPSLQLLRALVCVTGLALSALFLLARLRRRAGGAARQGGAPWMLLGVACAVMFAKPLLDDLLYLYGDLVPERLGPWIGALRAVEYVTLSLVPPLAADLLFRLTLPRLAWRWGLRIALAVLYAATLAAATPFAMGVAPAWLARAEATWFPGARLVAAGLVVLATLLARRAGTDAGERRRGERGAYLALATFVLAIEAAGWLFRDAWAQGLIELLLWSVPIPLLVALTWFRERTAAIDVLAKRGVFVLAALLALAAYFAFVPGRLWVQRIGWKGSWIFPVSALPFVLVAPWLSSWLSARLDRLWLGRALSPAQAQRAFLAGVGSAASEEELVRSAEERLASIFPLSRGPDARRRRVHVELGPAAARAGPGAPGEFQAPVVSQGACVGTMRIETPPEARPFLSEDQALFASLGEGLGLALEALRLRERKLSQERAEQELRLLAGRAELRALRAQINPHFVFNALNAIAELIAADPGKAERTVERLAEVLRRTLHRSEAEWVRVDEELALARAYLEVEQIRFGQRLETRVEIEAGAGEALLPAMVVQTLVENAVKHGISPCPGPGRVEVRASRAGGVLRVEVRDSGPGFPAGGPAAAPGGGIGLRNVQERLAGYFGEAGSLRVKRDQEAAMTVVTLSMPAVQAPVRAAR